MDPGVAVPALNPAMFSQYGAVGIMCGCLFVTMLLIFRVLFSRLLDHFDNFQKFMLEQTKATTESVIALRQVNEELADLRREITNKHHLPPPRPR